MVHESNSLRSYVVRAGLSLLALVFVSGVVFAEESLEDRVSALEQKSDNFGFDKRPYLQNDDGRFRIEFGARLQARYTLQVKETRGSSGSETSDESWAELERARLSFRGNFFSKNLKYKVGTDGHGDSSGGDLALTDAYIKYVCPDTGIAIGAGQWKPFFGRQEQTSSAKQLLVDRSMANEFFNIDRNIGIWLEQREKCGADGLFNGYSWQLAVSNGVDSTNKNLGDGEFDQIPAVIAHFDVDIFGALGKDALSAGDLKRRESPGLTMGVSFVTDHNNDSGSVSPIPPLVGTPPEDIDSATQYGVYQMAYDAVFKFAGFNVNGEYFQRWLDMDNETFASDSQFTHGGYIETGYMITDALQIVARASSIWDKDATGKSATEAGGGINYFFFKHNLKLSTDVVYLDIPTGMTMRTEELAGHTFDVATNGFDAFASSSANLDEFQGIMLRVQAQVNF